jgi:hypothetical protein
MQQLCMQLWISAQYHTNLWNHVLWQVVKSVTTVAKLMGLLEPAA